MLLSQTAIYALRCLAILITLEPGERLTGKTLSERTDVPHDYLNKVMRQLGQAGIVRAVRGNSGGFSMNRPSHKVRIADVLNAVDMQLDLGKCAFSTGNCVAAAPCALHAIWSSLQGRVGAWAEDTKLSDIDKTSHS